MKCVDIQNLLAAEILGDLDRDPLLCRDVREHLRDCPACAAERVELAQTIGFIRQHKRTVAEVCERLDSSQRRDDPEPVRTVPGIARPRVLAARRMVRRTRFYAAAASVLIGVCIWLAAARVRPDDRSSASPLVQAAQPRVELLADGIRTAVPAGAEIATAAGERKTVLIDGVHEMALNAHTRLRVEAVEKDGWSGPLIRLELGEILTHVEHTGRPFLVSTQLGTAVITGTTFAIQADDNTMNLVVAEGSVRLESPQGEVQVHAGFASAIRTDHAPSAPHACDIRRALAWACDGPPAPSDGAGPSAGGDLTDLWLTASSGPVRLEAIDYHEWTARQEAWFAREFPWIFRVQDATTRGGRQVAFPQLLVESGDIRQFALPDTAGGPVARLCTQTWQALAERYGIEPDPPARATAQTSREMPRLAAALPAWEAQFRQAEHAPQDCIPDILMRSLHAGAYLVNTRTLLWLYLRHEQTAGEDPTRSDLLDLLQEQVRLADGLTRQFILLIAHGQDMSCAERAGRYRQIADELNELHTIEERFCRYEALE